jgi:Tol biopolymer transport system component
MSKIAQRPTAVFSPDGRWLAYTSNESGRSEVFVRSFPGPGAQWQVSTSGGRLPTWSRRRNELFYLSPDSHLMVVSYTIEGDTFRANPPQKWSEQLIAERPTSRWFDLHPDGDRFLVSGDSGDENERRQGRPGHQFLRRSAPALIRRQALDRLDSHA